MDLRRETLQYEVARVKDQTVKRFIRFTTAAAALGAATLVVICLPRVVANRLRCTALVLNLRTAAIVVALPHQLTRFVNKRRDVG